MHFNQHKTSERSFTDTIMIKSTITALSLYFNTETCNLNDSSSPDRCLDKTD